MTPEEELEQSLEGLVEMAKEEGFSLEEVQKALKKLWDEV
jgi:DNA-binding transcriptional regulator YhcF (GntR family)